MMTRARLGRALLLPATALVLAACDGNTAPGTGELTVLLTDAPFPWEQVQRADVHVVRIDAKLAEAGAADIDDPLAADPASGWVTIAAPDQTYDLLQLRNGATANLGQATLPTGRYRGFRLILDTDRSSVTLADGTVLTGASSPGIEWPSAAETGIKIVLDEPIEVTADGTVMVLDFDLARSFVLRGNRIAQNGLLFTPVIRATATDITGSIAGTVTAGATPAATPGAVVEVFAPGVAAAVHTTTTDDAGHYAFPFVLPGSYDLRATGAAGSGLGAKSVEDVVVRTGEETLVDIHLPAAAP
jgi:predicted small secreted protein